MATLKDRLDALVDAEVLKLNQLNTEKEAIANKKTDLTSSDVNFYPNVPAVKTGLSLKVDKVNGKGLSDENYTSAEKSKLAGLESSKYRGLFISEADLPTTANVAGSYADVDTGSGNDTQRFIWDVNDSEWIVQGGASTALTPAQIKSMYESNPDTNAFTDDEKLAIPANAADILFAQNDLNNYRNNVVGVGPFPDYAAQLLAGLDF